MDLYDLDLIDEYNNCYLIAFIDAVNRIANGESVKKYSFFDMITESIGDRAKYFKSVHDEMFKDIEILLCRNDDKTLSRYNDVRLPICLSMTEKIYLKAIMQSRYSRLMFDEKEIAETLDKLADVPNIPINEYCESISHNDRAITDTVVENFRLLLKAIREKREIIYSNKTRSKRYENKRGYPVRIEYSVLHDGFQLSLWSEEEERPIKLNLHTMYNIRLTERVRSDAIVPSIMMKGKLCSEPMELELSSSNNTFERANIMLSMFNTRSEMSEGGANRMRIHYYEFDEDDIINMIFSFGPYIKIVSPQRAVEKIKAKVVALSEKY